MNHMFAVQNVVTGKFLPFTKIGYTSVEPMDLSEAAPRLHKNYKSANQAMHAYCRGQHIANWEYSDGDEWSIGQRYVEGFKIKPMAGRNIAEFRVVKITLIIEDIHRD